MREAFNKQYAKLPSYEEWLRDRGKESEADEYRFRMSETPVLILMPDSLSATDNQVKDIRGFEAKADKSGVRFIDRDSGALAFLDAGRKISLYATDDAAILGSLQLGMQNWGSVHLTGSDEYKARCIELAVEHGIKITNPELRDAIDKQTQRKRVAHIEEQMIKHSRASSKAEQFSKYHVAVGASRYRVSATQIREDGSKRGFMVNKSDGAPEGFTASELIGKIKKLIVLQDSGRNIYLTPVSDDKHHFLIDDLDHEDLAAFLADGYRPCAIIETSPNNFQAIITIPKPGTEHDHEIANRIVRDLNTKYGDPKLSGEVHAHRAPGFENRKPKHRRDDGTFPEAKLVKAERVECPKTAALARSLLEALQRQEADRQRKLDGVMASLPADKSGLDVIKAYELYFKDILRIQHDDKKQDLSRLDSMTAVRLRATGHSKDEVREAIELLAPRMRTALGEPFDTHRWPDYAARTAGYAFGKAGEKSIEKLSSYVDHWKKLEEAIMPKAAPTIETPKPQEPAEQTAKASTSKTSTPKTLKTEQAQEAPAARPNAPQKSEAPKPKPLSTEVDPKRLAELRKLREDAAEAYADPIMEEEKQAKLAEIQAQRPAAEKALADAEQALRDHEETDIELTFLERTFGGKRAQSKIAAHESKIEGLKKAVQKCKDTISVINAEERDPLGDSGRARRKQLEAKGRDDYDKAHPGEVREREMLEELYEKNVRYLSYVSNPVSQPTGHKHDIERVARIMEIEARRGLAAQEVVAKHKGVRNVVEVIEKYRGREIDRGLGR